MARLFFPSSSDSVTCKRCGNDIPSDADTCPHCGADHGPGFGAAKTAALSTGLRLPFGARREALNVPSPYPSVPEESELTGAGEQRWDRSKTVTLGAVALALVAGGVIYSQHGSSGDDATRSDLPAGHSAYGAVDMKTAHDAPARLAAPAAAVPPARSAAAVATMTTTRQAQTAAAPSVAAREALPTDTSSSRAAAALASATDNLQAARDAIARGDLTTARRRFSKIPASQLNAANVQRTQADLTGLEHARDEMLQVARGCEATGSWLCVRQNARDVLTIDASNVEAQTLVEHAIARSGWLNKTPPATAAVHGAPHNSAQTAAAAPAAPVPMFVPGPRVAPAPPPASTHRPTVTVSAAQHARAVAAMGVPAPIVAPVPAAPAAPVVVTTVRTPAAAQAVPEPARISTGSQAPLTSSPSTPPPTLQQAAPPRPPAPAFVPMPDGPNAAPPAVRSAPANATARAPAQPEPEPAAAIQAPGNTASPSLHTVAPIGEAVPVRAGIVSPPVAANSAPPTMQSNTRPASPTANRTLASGDNAASAAQPRAPGFNATNPDDEERAILESGWARSQSPAQRPPPQ
ncbi:zinc ribbon domain-containing protein [Caballeronia sp. dw_19]|uniref:zinc ribbon domain-containing protein n=1 Tax=Caballeronia sp. dw_19 TaxID=2719791 RepID=UPI001BD59497|nr:zinc ribbon domain-containing protein [Caballeronia sp. dw_19]